MLRRYVWTAVVAGVMMSGQVSAGVGDFLVSSRFYGLLSSGAGVYFVVEANDARSNANNAYELYETTNSPVLAREFYDESRREDTKAAILLGLGVGTITYGVHLILKGDSGKLPDPEMDRGLVEVKGVRVDAGPDPNRGGLGVRLRRSF